MQMEFPLNRPRMLSSYVLRLWNFCLLRVIGEFSSRRGVAKALVFRIIAKPLREVTQHFIVSDISGNLSKSRFLLEMRRNKTEANSVFLQCFEQRVFFFALDVCSKRGPDKGCQVYNRSKVRLAFPVRRSLAATLWPEEHSRFQWLKEHTIINQFMFVVVKKDSWLLTTFLNMMSKCWKTRNFIMPPSDGTTCSLKSESGNRPRPVYKLYSTKITRQKVFSFELYEPYKKICDNLDLMWE